MAELVKSPLSVMPIFFNIGGKVGQGGANAPEDVALVTYMMRIGVKGASNPKVKQIFSNIQVTSSCTPQLIQAIRDIQIETKTVVDGYLSPAKPGAYYGNSPFLIARLNASVKLGNQDWWPRIDRIPEAPTPPEVFSLIKRTLIGTG